MPSTDTERRCALLRLLFDYYLVLPGPINDENLGGDEFIALVADMPGVVGLDDELMRRTGTFSAEVLDLVKRQAGD